MNELFLKNGLPLQKVSSKEKTKKWFIECAKSAFNLAVRKSNYGRKSVAEKIENMNLYAGIIDEKNMEKSFNTIGIEGAKFAPKFQHYPLLSPRIDLLCGELDAREFDYVIAAINHEAISNKLNKRREEFINIAKELFVEEEFTPEYVKQRIEEFEKTDPRSLAEIQIDELMQLYAAKLDFNAIDKELFKLYLLTGEKIGCVELVNGKPEIRVCDTLNTFVAMDGGSDKVADAEVVTEVWFKPVGSIIEEYYDDLDKDQLDILIGKKESSANGFGITDVSVESMASLVFTSLEDLETFTSPTSSNVNKAYDLDGNIRVARIKWKGFRKVLRLKSYSGTEIVYSFVNENYKANKSRGEEVEVKYFTEWHEATLIGTDTWVRCKICDMQFRSYSSPYESKSGYFGDYNITGVGVARCLMDRGRSLSYYYDMVFARLEDMLSKNIGKVIELDLAKMPEKWNPKLWLYYLKVHNVAVVNSFKAGDKGIAQGKLAGNYNTSGRGIDMELSGSIVIYINILEKIEDIIAKVTGITDQRLGHISANELVGNVKRSTIQSNHITDGYFSSLDSTRLEYYKLMMDAIRVAHYNDKKLLQYSKDDKNLVFINVDGELLNSEDLAIFPVNNIKNTNFAATLRNAIEQQFASGNGDIDALVMAYSTNSIAKLQQGLKKIQDARQLREQELMKQQEELKAKNQKELIDYENKKISERLDREIKLKEFELRYKMEQLSHDSDRDGVEDNVQVKVADIRAAVDRERMKVDKEIAELKVNKINK